MIVSTTNITPLATVTATPDSSLQDISVITDGDYSSVYTDALTVSTSILFEFPTPQNIGYIAIGGSNISQKDRIEIRSVDTSQAVYLFASGGEALFSSDGFRMTALYDNSVDDTLLGTRDAETLMYQVDILNSQEIEIIVYGTGQLAIADIAMGSYYEIPRGEQAGYVRPWSKPNIESRSAVGLNSSPISMSYQATAIQCTLSVPNNIMDDYDSWYNFLDFASSNTFYILEDGNKFHSYACFNATPNTTNAHSQTRALGVSSIKFNAFSKTSGVTF